jgi:hypothetical protein
MSGRGERQEGYELLGGDARVDNAIAQPIADGIICAETKV